jgi:hypothetical protein
MKAAGARVPVRAINMPVYKHDDTVSGLTAVFTMMLQNEAPPDIVRVSPTHVLVFDLQFSKSKSSSHRSLLNVGSVPPVNGHLSPRKTHLTVLRRTQSVRAISQKKH